MHLFDDLKRVFVDLDLGSFVEKLGYFIILVVRRGYWCLHSKIEAWGIL